jgi:magnesium chelatase family protein
MGLALVHSRARVGVSAPAVAVEVHLAGGLPRMSIVGLPEAAVREAKDRVRAAIACAQFEFPTRAITVNLAPADLPKDGGRFDLPIALGVLAASGQIPFEALAQHEFLGELGLTGELRVVDGVLPAALAAARSGRILVVPEASGSEAALARDAQVRTARTLLEVCAGLSGRRALAEPQPPSPRPWQGPDLADVRGQAQARRALEIAAAGSHHLLLIGPPGCGKTLLASRLPGILPEASEDEALAAAAIASVSGSGISRSGAGGRGLDPARWRERPYRAPHHTASAVALVGGGAQPRPGEISLAHNGVLFLDELPEWDRRALEVLREPLESGVVTISRAARQSEFPARFQLVAAMNPCPCGWAGDPGGRCRCGAEAIRRYLGRISGPLLDRIDLQVEVPRLPPGQLRPDAPSGESSALVRGRVEAARARAHARDGVPNAALGQSAMRTACRLAEHDQRLLEQAVETLRLSARSMQRILRVARTIADLDGSGDVTTVHLTEAIGYRRLERGFAALAA